MRTRLVILVVLLLTSYGAIRGFFALQEANRTIKQLESSLAQAKERSGRVAEAVQDVIIVQSVQRKELEHVFEKNSDWSNAPVPDDVADRLCGFLSCE